LIDTFHFVALKLLSSQAACDEVDFGSLAAGERNAVLHPCAKCVLMDTENPAYLMELIPWLEMPLIVRESGHDFSAVWRRTDIGLSKS
jgi:hypothetical protein